MLEQSIAEDLEERGVPVVYEDTTLLYVEPAMTRRYTPDFTLPNGILVEVKGRFTARDRKKMLYVIEQNPELDIRLLLAADNKLSKTSKTRYSAWCDKRGIKYAVGKTIPEKWIKEKRRRKKG